MKNNKFFGLLIIVALLVALIPNSFVSAAATKVDVCHLDKDAGIFFMINISDNAFDTHVAHGDAAPGDLVPGMPGKKFAADCSIVNVRDLIDTVTVYASGAVASSVALENGVVYEFEASGTYRFVNWGTFPETGIADARASYRIPSSYNPYGVVAWVDGSLLPLAVRYYLQIWVNGAHFEWGTVYNSSHVYISSFTGAGTAVNFKIVDDNYGDNSGFLTVKIYHYN